MASPSQEQAKIAAALARVLSKKGLTKETQAIAKAAAERQARDSDKLLSPMDVAGEYDSARVLWTTLGGQPRVLTHDDLRTFAATAKKLGKRFKGGITARGVLDHSLKVDRDRTNREIRTAVVVRAKAGVLHFTTNAGPESDVVRHHVYVQFPAFQAYAAQGQKPERLAQSMLSGPVKWTCDCGRERFWFAYLMTIGGFKYGEQQPNFPKIRNPKLVGVACKHALRVMQAVLTDPHVKGQATKMIAAAQVGDTKIQQVTAAAAKAAAEKQLAQAHHLKNRAETTDEIAKRRGSTAVARARALMAATQEAKRRAAALAAQGRRQLESAFAKLKTVPLTKAQRDAFIAKLMAAKTTD